MRVEKEKSLWFGTMENLGCSQKFIHKFLLYFITFCCCSSYLFYILKIASPLPPSMSTETSNNDYELQLESPLNHENHTNFAELLETNPKTQLHHIVFGIGASSNLWEERKQYINLWWKPGKMRGYVWMDEYPATSSNDEESLMLPQIRVSEDTSDFEYQNPEGTRSGLRISRILSETVRLGLEDVRWIVLGDDDTFFVVENLVRVLEKYDHNGFYYIGSNSETHFQNIKFSYNMAYGGGGFAISYPLAKALEGIQDGCMKRYPELYGSDDRIHACMAELGVPLTKHVGFHQFDIYGNAFGLLTAHPVTPLVSLHHLDLIQPIFPDMKQFQALQRLKTSMDMDSAGLIQQSICYDKARNWTISISWGYAAQIFRGLISAREMELPAITFSDWYRQAEPLGFTFNTRPFNRYDCQTPFVYLLSNSTYDPHDDQTVSAYTMYQKLEEQCWWKTGPNPSHIREVEVYKKPNPNLWDKPPRRNCCRVLPSGKEYTYALEVGECKVGETII